MLTQKNSRTIYRSGYFYFMDAAEPVAAVEDQVNESLFRCGVLPDDDVHNDDALPVPVALLVEAEEVAIAAQTQSLLLQLREQPGQ